MEQLTHAFSMFSFDNIDRNLTVFLVNNQVNGFLPLISKFILALQAKIAYKYAVSKSKLRLSSLQIVCLFMASSLPTCLL